MIQVTMHSNIGFNFAPGTTMVSTNIDSYYPTLAQAYSEGYRLTTFYRIPGAAKQQGFMSTAVNIPFQGIFTKWVYTVVVHSGLLELCKSMMEFHTTSYILQLITQSMRNLTDGKCKFRQSNISYWKQ